MTGAGKQPAPERDRLAAVYARYGRSARKSRAWSGENRGNRANREQLATAMLELSAGARAGGGDLLDAGCGAGWWLRRLYETGVAPDRLHGVDLLGERVAKTRRAVPRAHLAEGDVRRLPYAGASFSAVFLVTVLSSLPDAASVRCAVAEAWRVLAPGGVMVVWEARWPNPLNPATRLVRAPAVSAVMRAPPAVTTPITLAPPLARRLGPAAERWHPRLARVPPLCTHRLSAWLRPPGRD